MRLSLPAAVAAALALVVVSYYACPRNPDQPTMSSHCSTDTLHSGRGAGHPRPYDDRHPRNPVLYVPAHPVSAIFRIFIPQLTTTVVRESLSRVPMRS